MGVLSRQPFTWEFRCLFSLSFVVRWWLLRVGSRPVTSAS